MNRGRRMGGAIQMAHGVARWPFVSVSLFLFGAVALAQTDQPLPAPAAQSPPTITRPAQWVAGFRMDCGPDVQRFCHGVQPGDHRLIRCLSSHRSQLSPACTTRLATMRIPAGPPLARNPQSAGLPSASPLSFHAVTEPGLRASCGPDVQRLCAGVLRQNGDLIECLSSQRVDLSPTCDAFLSENLMRHDAQKRGPKRTAPPTNSPAAAPAANGATETFASPPKSPAGTRAAADGATETLPSPPTAGPTPAAADGATETLASPSTAGPAATPTAPDGTAETVAPPPGNDPVATAATADGAADTVVSSPTNGPTATATAAPQGAAETIPSTADRTARSAVVDGQTDTVAPPPTNGPPRTNTVQRLKARPQQMPRTSVCNRPMPVSISC
jgi:hypothetical protein